MAVHSSRQELGTRPLHKLVSERHSATRRADQHRSFREVPRIVVRDTLVCLLAGGEGERLIPLTRDRAKPAVPFGGIYRIIDLTLSNCINSDLRHIYVLTQYKALSLNRHIREGWSILAHELGEFITVLPPMKRVGDHWYQGTADAIYQNLYSIGSEPCKYVLILSGDHVYKMNYQLMLKQHVDSGAGVTVGTIEFDRSEASRFGVCEIDSAGRIVGWQEKPADPKPSAHDPDQMPRFHGHLLLQPRPVDRNAAGGRRRSGIAARFWQERYPQADREGLRLLVQFHRRKQEGSLLLAGHRDH